MNQMCTESLRSGGMYNTNFPQWEDATATGNKKYDGQFAYAYAKRGQVLLCERWAAQHPKVGIGHGFYCTVLNLLE